MFRAISLSLFIFFAATLAHTQDANDTQPTPLPTAAPSSTPEIIRQPFGSVFTRPAPSKNGVLVVITFRPNVDPATVKIESARGQLIPLNQAAGKALDTSVAASLTSAKPCPANTGALCISVPFGDPGDGSFWLPKNWKSFDLTLDYQHQGKSDSLPAFRVNSETTTIPVKVDRKRLTWLGGTARGDDSAEVVLRSEFDVRVAARIRKDGRIIAEGTALLEKGQDTAFVLRQNDNTSIGPDEQYDFELARIEPDLPVEFSLDEPHRTWQSPSQKSSIFEVKNLGELRELNVVDRNQRTIKVNLSSVAKRLEARYNDDSKATECEADEIVIGQYHCPIKHEVLNNGRLNRLYLSGTSIDDRDLKNRSPFAFSYDTSFRLVGGIRMTETNGDLTIIVKLDKKPNPLGVGLTIQPMIVDDSQGLVPQGGRINIEPSNCPNEECRFVINRPGDINQLISGFVENPKIRRALLVSVVVGPRTRNGMDFTAPPIGQITFDTNSANARLVAQLKTPAIEAEIRQYVERTRFDTPPEKLFSDVKSILKLSGDPTDKETEAINFIVNTIQSKPGKKDKVWSIVRFIGQTALAYFGVPIKLPSTP